MFRHMRLRVEAEEDEKQEEVEGEEAQEPSEEQTAEEPAEEKQEGEGDESKEDESEGTEEKAEDSEEKDESGEEKKDESSDQDDSKSEGDAEDQVEEEEGEKAEEQPTSEPQQQSPEANKEPEASGVNSQPHEAGVAEVAANGTEISNNSPTIVISGFSCSGKTTYAAKHQDSKDLESSLYSKNPDGSKNPDFPGNYINMIKWHLVNNQWKYLFVSCHEDVRKALQEDGINFFIVYPAKERKEEILKLMKERGNTDEYIKLMEENWDTWIDEISKEKKSYALKEGEFISDELFETSLKFLKQ